jgi:hypothetical protein
MNFKELIGTIGLLVFLSYGCGLVPDQEGNKISEDGDGSNDEKVGDFLGPVTTDCSVVVAESSPMQVTRTCKVEGKIEGDVTFKLEYVPVDTLSTDYPIDVTVNGVDWPEVYDYKTNVVTLSGLSQKAEPLEVIFSFDSEEKFITTGDEVEETVTGRVFQGSIASGCDWLIDLGDTTIYEAKNLAQEFQKAHVHIEFSAEELDSPISSVCTAGSAVSVSQVVLVSPEDRAANCVGSAPDSNSECKISASGCLKDSETGAKTAVKWEWIGADVEPTCNK